MRVLTTAAALAAFAVLAIVSVALGQDGGPITEPTVGLLASAAGVSAVIFVITNVLRTVIPADVFDRWAAALAVVIGIVLAELYAITQTGVTSESLIQAALVGLFAGGFSQNVNNIVARARA